MGSPMAMVFHNTIHTHVLFSWWKVDTWWEYILSCVAVFIVSAAAQLSFAMLHNLKSFNTKISLIDIVKVLLSMFSLMASFCMMLVAMSFNAGLFCCVVLGATTGWTAVFWHGAVAGKHDNDNDDSGNAPLLMHQ